MYLFSTNGLKHLESICFTKTLFSFDFDGTLSKIVKDPQKARMNASTSKLLLQLGELAPVAVISGRGLEDLKTKFESSVGWHLVGNHGLEGIDSENQKKQAFRELCESWNIQLRQQLTPESSQFGGIEIENKIYSITIHYRGARQSHLAKTTILEVLKRLQPPPRIVMAKCAINLLPSAGPHKGVALLELMRKTNVKSAFYIGDDDTDEDVFALSDGGLFTVRVGRKNSSQAKFHIHRQSQIDFLLKRLLSYLKKPLQEIEETRLAPTNIHNRE